VQLDALFDRHMRFAGDRVYGEDASLVGGVAWLNDLRCVFIAAETSSSTPAAFGKAARMVRLAEQTGAPCILVGAATTLHLAAPADPRGAAAFDVYLAALASARGTRIAVAESSAVHSLTDAFDTVVSGTEVATVRAGLAAALAGRE
jgi:acetyl-CoA carboxylase alpha subunit